MGTTSVWSGTAAPTRWSALEHDVAADVAVVGGGITGVTTAFLLAKAGRSVVLLEAGEIGGGDTGNSTGNLYETVSGGLYAVKDKWSAEVAASVSESRREAVAMIESHVQALGIDCGFRRCPMHLYAGAPGAQGDVEREFDAARSAGLPVRLEDTLPDGPPAAHGRVLVLDQQAQFHPMAYVRSLAAHAGAAGCRVFERSAVLDVDHSEGLVRTTGGTVAAGEIVLATHSPSGFHVTQGGMIPNREYGLAAPLGRRDFPPGIFWARGDEHLSVRSLETASANFLLCVGQEQKTGQHDARAAMAALEAAARRRLGVQEVAYRWSAQNFRSPDALPYIGQDASGAYIATGFATDGLVYGTLAASIISDDLLGRGNRWSNLYRASRVAPVKAAKGTVAETASVLKVVLQDYLTRRQHEQLETLPRDAGSIVEVDGERLAAYRDGAGQVFVVSPVCTHLKCMVHWNALETSWDCPCHGSRFAPDGRVIAGPAIEPLKTKTLPEGRRTA